MGSFSEESVRFRFGRNESSGKAMFFGWIWWIPLFFGWIPFTQGIFSIAKSHFLGLKNLFGGGYIQGGNSLCWWKTLGWELPCIGGQCFIFVKTYVKRNISGGKKYFLGNTIIFLAENFALGGIQVYWSIWEHAAGWNNLLYRIYSRENDCRWKIMLG